MQGPGNQNRKNVTLKTNTDTGSCGSSWYSKKKLQAPGKPIQIGIQKTVPTSTTQILGKR